ncbi:MAG: hypothetical protein ACK5KU_05465 [Beutenbergiaceae bacterium]
MTQIHAPAGLGEVLRARALAAAPEDLNIPVMEEYEQPSIGGAAADLVADLSDYVYELRTSLEALSEQFDSSFQDYQAADEAVAETLDSVSGELGEGFE